MTEVSTSDERNGDGCVRFVHADAVVIAETGVLIRGASGSGKSRLALTLIFMAEAAGYFTRLVGDDRVCLDRCSDRLVVRGHPSIRGEIEWRGQGIVQTDFLDAAVLGLVIDLVSATTALLRFPEDEGQKITLEGVSLPAMVLPDNLGPSDQAAYILQHFRLGRKKSRRTTTRMTFP